MRSLGLKCADTVCEMDSQQGPTAPQEPAQHSVTTDNGRQREKGYIGAYMYTYGSLSYAPELHCTLPIFQ